MLVPSDLLKGLPTERIMDMTTTTAICGGEGPRWSALARAAGAIASSPAGGVIATAAAVKYLVDRGVIFGTVHWPRRGGAY